MSLSTLLSPIRWLLLTIGTIALLILVILGLHSWLAARDAVTQLSAIISSQKQLLDEATSQEQQRDAAAAKTVASIQRATAAVKTPAEAARQIPQILPELPIPLDLNLPAPDAANPSPAATATVPQADLQPIYDDIQECRICQTKLAAAQADLASEHTKEAAITKERDAAVKAAHGGSFWTRIRSGAKWLLIGAAAGAIATEASHIHATH